MFLVAATAAPVEIAVAIVVAIANVAGEDRERSRIVAGTAERPEAVKAAGPLWGS